MSDDAEDAPKSIRGREAVLFVTAYFALASLFFLFDFQKRMALIAAGNENSANAFAVALVAIRPCGAVLLTILLWKYSKAIGAYNRGGESARSKLESSHALLWRLGAVFLAIHLLSMVLVVF